MQLNFLFLSCFFLLKLRFFLSEIKLFSKNILKELLYVNVLYIKIQMNLLAFT